MADVKLLDCTLRDGGYGTGALAPPAASSNP